LNRKRMVILTIFTIIMIFKVNVSEVRPQATTDVYLRGLVL